MTTTAQPEQIADTPKYWTHKVDAYPSPVSVIRMSQLIDLDSRLYETARVVYRFLISWYHEGHGDALLSMRHVSQVVKQRAPEGAIVLSRSAVHRAIIALMETGWVVRTLKGRGKGKGASRFVPVLNVLELAAQGKFPQPSHDNGTVVSHDNGTVEREPSHANGTKTRLLDTLGGVVESKGNDVSAAPPSDGLSATAAASGFEEIWKAYGKLGNKKSARDAFAEISDPDVHHISERAAAWAASAKPGQRRMPLEKWLAAEKYDEADRKVATQPKPSKVSKPELPKPSSAAASAATEPAAEPDNDNIPDFMMGSPRLWPKGRHVGEFVEGHVDDQSGDHEVTLAFKIHNGGDVFKHRFLSQAYIKSYQDEGQAIIKDICHAVGLAGVSDTDDLLFRPLVAVADGDTIQYFPLEISEAA